MIEKQLLRVPEAASALGLGRAKTWELIRTGRLRSVKIDAARRVPVEAIAEFIDALAAEQAEGVTA